MKPNRQILDEAAEWLVELREGAPDAAAQQNFNSWLRRSPEHVEAYMEMAALWDDVALVEEKESLDVAALVAYGRTQENVVPLAVSEEAGVVSSGRSQRVVSALKESPSLVEPVPAKNVGKRYAVALAASLAIAATGALLFFYFQPRIYITEAGEQRSIKLPDGSAIELNVRSKIAVRYSKERRNIELVAGQAMFTVAKDPARPFVVASGDLQAEALGTQFDVYRKDTGIIVTVLDGRVAVAQGEAPSATILTSGQQLALRSKTAPPKPQAADLATTAWIKRQILFDGTPLREVVEEFNRYNLRQMSINDASLGGLRISGVFSSTDPASLIRFLREQVQLQVSEEDGGVHIARQ